MIGSLLIGIDNGVSLRSEGSYIVCHDTFDMRQLILFRSPAFRLHLIQILLSGHSHISCYRLSCNSCHKSTHISVTFKCKHVIKLMDGTLHAKGGMTENYVNTQLVRAGFKSYFWRNDKGTKEVDFVISLKGKLIPVEVKSGEHVTAVSLNEYVSLFKPAYSIRISEKNFGLEMGIKSVPLYAVFCICDD